MRTWPGKGLVKRKGGQGKFQAKRNHEQGKKHHQFQKHKEIKYYSEVDTVGCPTVIHSPISLQMEPQF